MSRLHAHGAGGAQGSRAGRRRPWMVAAVLAMASVHPACGDDGSPDEGGDPTTTTTGPAPTSGDGGADTEAGDPGGGTGRTESGDDPVGTGSEPEGGGPEPSP
jgi:hypothetical protein